MGNKKIELGWFGNFEMGWHLLTYSMFFKLMDCFIIYLFSILSNGFSVVCRWTHNNHEPK